jgi:hypothetical protein
LKIITGHEQVTNGPHDFSQPVALDQFSTDHLPVLFDVYSGSLSLNCQKKVPSYTNANWSLFMSYLNQELDLQNVPLSTVGDPPEIDLMVSHLTSCILGVKNIAVLNVVPYRYKLKLVLNTHTFQLPGSSQSNVIPILKPWNDPSDPKSYKPISLLNALSNIRPVCCFWWLKRLLKCRFPMVYITLIWTFLTVRKLYVPVARDRSAEECEVFSGVPQGVVLSPTLFSIFTSDFRTLTDVQLALFADDSTLFSTHAKADVIIGQLQLALNTVKRYYSTWIIKLSPSKTQAVLFTKSRTRKFPTYDLFLDGYSIPWSDRAILFGLAFG